MITTGWKFNLGDKVRATRKQAHGWYITMRRYTEHLEWFSEEYSFYELPGNAVWFRAEELEKCQEQDK